MAQIWVIDNDMVVRVAAKVLYIMIVMQWVVTISVLAIVVGMAAEYR